MQVQKTHGAHVVTATTTGASQAKGKHEHHVVLILLACPSCRSLGLQCKSSSGCVACSADAPTKTNLNGKVLARLRSTAGTNLLPQSGGLARSSSSLSGDLQLSPPGSGTLPSIGRLGSIAAGPPQLNKLAPAVGLGAARRSADLPLQQLMGMQTPGVPCIACLFIFTALHMHKCCR